jgi:hypothetical protein
LQLNNGLKKKVRIKTGIHFQRCIPVEDFNLQASILFRRQALPSLFRLLQWNPLPHADKSYKLSRLPVQTNGIDCEWHMVASYYQLPNAHLPMPMYLLRRIARFSIARIRFSNIDY